MWFSQLANIIIPSSCIEVFKMFAASAILGFAEVPVFGRLASIHGNG